MDWWLILKCFWGGIGLGLVVLILIVAWRARGVISWTRAIRNELKTLSIEAAEASPARKAGIRLVVAECERILGAFKPEQGIQANHFRTMIRSIAACFYPEAERPELQISLGHLIQSLDASLYRFDRIIHRPGLGIIETINIHTIQRLYHWSNELLKRPWIKWYLAHHHRVQGLMLIRLFIIPDPLSWIFFLSRKILILVLMRNLLADIILFTGRLALDAFDGQKERPLEKNRASPEAVLEDLSHLEIPPAMENDPEIAAIRQNLVGFSAIMISNPTWQDWKTAVREAAQVIARRSLSRCRAPHCKSRHRSIALPHTLLAGHPGQGEQRRDCPSCLPDASGDPVSSQGHVQPDLYPSRPQYGAELRFRLWLAQMADQDLPPRETLLASRHRGGCGMGAGQEISFGADLWPDIRSGVPGARVGVSGIGRHGIQGRADTGKQIRSASGLTISQLSYDSGAETL